VAKKSGKGRKARAYTCLNCGRGMKRKQVTCKCGQMRPLGATAKGSGSGVLPAPAVLYKAYGGNVVPISQGKAARTCWNGHRPGGKGSRFCVDCGEPYGLSYADHEVRQIRKSAAASQTPAGLLAQVHACDDPAAREMYWSAYQASLNGGRPA
jgi:hypothetical protein